MVRQYINRKNVGLYNEYLRELIENNKIDDSKTNNNKHLIMINELLQKLNRNSYYGC